MNVASGGRRLVAFVEPLEEVPAAGTLVQYLPFGP